MSTADPVAVVTGASRGLGRALAHALAVRGWTVVVDGRDEVALDAAMWSLPRVVAIPGDVTDPSHRELIGREVDRLGRLDLLVNNASDLGPSPLPPLSSLPVEALDSLLLTNVVAPLGLLQRMLPRLVGSAGAIVNISSDAAVEVYDGWGGYGASKAALDQLTAVLAVENPSLAVYAFDPGDMRTAMHQAAFPGEDISDRPEPETVVPALLRLVDDRPPSGRYRAAELLAPAGRVA